MKKYLILFVLIVLPSQILLSQGNNELKDEIAIKKTALDYAEAYYDGDGDRMERAIHADLNKVIALRLPQTGKTVLQYSTVSQLVELSSAKAGYLAPEKRKLNVTVLLHRDEIACVKLTSAFFNDYLQMVNFEGQWKIVNVLWSLGPDVPNRPQLSGIYPDKREEEVKLIIQEFYESQFTGDFEKLIKIIHPEISIAQLSYIPQTKKIIISRSGSSIFFEIARAKLSVVPEDQRHLDLNILDIMDDMAFVEVFTPISNSYFQLQHFDGRWNIINCLSIPNSITP